MKTRVFLTLSFSLFVLLGFSQKTLSGIVESEDGSAIPFAKIRVDQSQKGTISNVEGKFKIENIASDSKQIIVSALGYAEQEISIKGNTRNIKVQLFKQVQNLETVQVDATRPQIVPSSATQIDKEEDLQGKNFGQDLPILLNTMPSVVTTSDAGAGIGYTGMRIRGVDAERINVTINGIPVNDPESHGTWWVNMPDLVGSVDNIQVQRGVGTSTNGAASFGASVNIKTDNISEKAYGTIDNAVGSFNTWKSSVRAGTGLIGGKFAMDVRLSRVLSDGFIDRASSNLKSFYLSGSYVGKKSLIKAVAFSGKERTYQSWYGTPESVINGDANEMNAYADRNYLSDAERTNLLESGRSYNYYTYQDEVDNYQQDNYQLHFTHTFSPKTTLNIAGHYTKGRGYYEQYKFGENLSEYGLSNVIVGADTVTSTDLIRRRWLDNDFVGGVYSLSHTVNSNLSLQLGGAGNTYIGAHFGELVWARYASESEIYDRYYDNNAQKSEFSSYFKADYVKNNWSVYADVQYRLVDYNFGGFDDVSGNLIDLDQKEVYNFINPKVGGSFAFDANNRLFLSAGIGNREPVRKDFRESSMQSRPEHETLTDLELGHSFEAAKLQVRTNIYFMNYENQLINTGKVNDVGAYTRINVAESYRLGIELAAIVRPFDELDVHAGFTYSENKIASFTEYVDNYDNYDENGNMIQDVIGHTDTDMAFSPNVIGNVGFTYRPFDGLALNWMTKYVGDQFLDNTSNQDRKIDAFTYSNVSLNYTIEDLIFKSITLGVQCNNILDAKYQNNGYTWGYIAGGQRTVENFYYPQAGRNFMFRLLIQM
tara:strand:- start:415 stop:2880 length:2466 start_codon:yes stop_codon:yes gene_type:complete